MRRTNGPLGNEIESGSDRTPRFLPAKRPRRIAAGRERGSQLLEFALALPLLLLLVLGAVDFGASFAFKDKMTNAARDAARVAISIPINPPAGSSAACAANNPAIAGQVPPPCVVIAAVSALQQYMENAGADMSCIDPSSPTASGPDPFEYTYTCGSGVSVVIDRSYFSTGSAIPETRVVFSYPATIPLGAALFPEFPKLLQTTVTMANLL